MLVITRKCHERIILGDGVELVVLSVQGRRVKLGVRAPQSTRITRSPTCVLDPVPRDSVACVCE